MLHMGDIVREIDGRHLGRIEAVVPGRDDPYRVIWFDSGWISWCSPDQVAKVRFAWQ